MPLAQTTTDPGEAAAALHNKTEENSVRGPIHPPIGQRMRAFACFLRISQFQPFQPSS